MSLTPGFARRVGGVIDWKKFIPKEDVEVEEEGGDGLNGELPSTVEPSEGSMSTLAIEVNDVDLRTTTPSISPTLNMATNSTGEKLEIDRMKTHTGRKDHNRLAEIVNGDVPAVEISELRQLAWKGLTSELRPTIWKLLLGYLPLTASRRSTALDMKRRSYREAVDQYWHESDWSHDEELIFRQISVDMPRTCPEHRLFHIQEVQELLQRILFVWALKHPASSYVQGMNDLVAPFVFVFLLERCEIPQTEFLSMMSLDGVLDTEAIFLAEADAYWCLTALLDSIQDYYTFAQPGIQKRVHYLEDFIARVDPRLRKHLQKENLEFLQFSFRWLNCLLMRELPFELMIRVWDTYISETDGFAVFHVYVCAALLTHFSPTLCQLDFQELVIFLQNLPTEKWSSVEVDMILSQAFLWRTIFDDKKLQ